uniref:Claspin n=2 Tax=Lygus hesperus TaxID=30085 RepID=A0A0A9Y665_LYGHE
MIRERQISLPYHKPKQRSLADFLNRRKLAPTVRLKTTSDELAKVWKHVEEREKTAELFYRSESDEETEKTNEDESGSAKASDGAVIAQNHQDGTSGKNEVANHTRTAADRLQGCLDQPVAPVSQQMDSEEFPRLQLSEVLAESENTDNVNSRCVEENDISLNIDCSDEVDSAEKRDVVTAAVVEGVSSAPMNDTELSENSENVLQSSVLEDSAPLSGFSQNSLSEKINSLNPSIPKCPKISGAPDEVIDLDELSTKPGAFGLMQRFIKHSKLKSKPIHQQNVLSVMTSEVNDCGEIIKLSEETIKVNKKVEPKPGERLVVLKTTLQQKMAENRGQQLAKKLEEYKLYEEEFYGVVDNGEGEEDMFSEDECDEKEEKEEEENEAEENIDNPFLEEEAAESGNDDAADDEKDDVNEDDAEDEEKSDVEETASVLLGNDSDEEPEVEKDDSDTYPVSENDEADEDDVLPTPPLPMAFHSLAGTQNADSIDESQLMALCSGNFSSSTIDLKVLETSSEAFQNAEDEGSQVPSAKDSPKYAIDSDDEEIMVSKKQKNKKRKLSFSDDEDCPEDNGGALVESDDDEDNETMKLSLNDDEATERNEEIESDEENVGQEDLVEDEDDEEVQLAKKLSKGFLDKEAELSESEWGSEDEDEKGLDQYEEEEGDKEKISQRRLQKELGKIHMREVLADDNREIRILQELLLEDGDLHSDGPKRQRLFRWYNQDEDNSGERRPLDSGENANENEEEDEELWRRQRLERENFLRKKKIDNLELEIVDSPINLNDTRKSLKVTPKITPTTNKSPDPKSNFNIFTKRGSFLGRGEKMLSKLAEITNNAGTKENAFGNTRNNRNMVFSIVSPPKEKQNEELKPEAPLKRKGDFIATSIVKKIKFTRNNVTTKVSALDQLKLFEST